VATIGPNNWETNPANDTTYEVYFTAERPNPTVVGVPEVDLTHIMGTILTEGGTGRLAAALITLLDVATPALTAASVNQTGDAYAVVNNYAYGNAAIITHGDSAWITATGFSTHTAAAIKTAIEAGGSSIADILADTNILQTEWANDGRLDTILDTAAAAASVNVANKGEVHLNQDNTT